MLQWGPRGVDVGGNRRWAARDRGRRNGRPGYERFVGIDVMPVTDFAHALHDGKL